MAFEQPRETLQYCGMMLLILLSACALISIFSIVARENTLLYQIAAVSCWYLSMLFVTTYPLQLMHPGLVSNTLRLVVIALFASYLSVTEIWLTLESNPKVARSFGTIQQIVAGSVIIPLVYILLLRAKASAASADAASTGRRESLPLLGCLTAVFILASCSFVLLSHFEVYVAYLRQASFVVATDGLLLRGVCTSKANANRE